MFRGRKRIDSVYPTLSQCAYHLLHCAEIHQEGRFYDYMASIVFSAFAMESFMNYLGAKFFANWSAKERKLSRDKRQRKIYDYLNFKPDKAKRPYSTIEEIFVFRDSLAHAQRIVLCDTPESTQEDLKTDWEKYCTKENAAKAKKDIVNVMDELNKLAGFGDFSLAPEGDGEIGFL